MTQIIFCLSLFAAFSLAAQTEITPITFESAAEQTPLVELYTSEGCSSCPPAETWVSHLKTSPELWKDFVPVAFHVDYWDYLGWRDPWSSRQFSDRQRNYAASWRSDSVYTPGLVLNGREWRDWSRGKGELKRSSTKIGVLSVHSADAKRWSVSFTPVANQGSAFEVHAALLSSGVSSDVKAGENRGRILTHDFIVLNLVEAALHHNGEMSQGDLVLPKATNGRSAVAVWITAAGQMEPLQATGGWLDNGAGTH